jgi:selenocysteine lyase/cysteine desulfurase
MDLIDKACRFGRWYSRRVCDDRMISEQPRSFPVDWVRGQFPALRPSIENQPVIYLDGPGGTQVPEQVIDAIVDYLRTSNSNLGGSFATSAQTGELVLRTRIPLAEFIHAREPQEIVFGQNMTSLTFALSRSLARTWSANSEVNLLCGRLNQAPGP